MTSTYHDSQETMVMCSSYILYVSNILEVVTRTNKRWVNQTNIATNAKVENIKIVLAQPYTSALTSILSRPLAPSGVLGSTKAVCGTL